MSDKPDKSQKDTSNGSIPPHVLNLINEYAIGGFIMFYFNSKTGMPEHVFTFESPPHCLALQKYISDWDEALKNLNVDCAIDAIKSRRPPSDEEENEEVE